MRINLPLVLTLLLVQGSVPQRSKGGDSYGWLFKKDGNDKSQKEGGEKFFDNKENEAKPNVNEKNEGKEKVGKVPDINGTKSKPKNSDKDLKRKEDKELAEEVENTSKEVMNKTKPKKEKIENNLGPLKNGSHNRDIDQSNDEVKHSNEVKQMKPRFKENKATESQKHQTYSSIENKTMVFVNDSRKDFEKRSRVASAEAPKDEILNGKGNFEEKSIQIGEEIGKGNKDKKMDKSNDQNFEASSDISTTGKVERLKNKLNDSVYEDSNQERNTSKGKKEDTAHQKNKQASGPTSNKTMPSTISQVNKEESSKEDDIKKRQSSFQDKNKESKFQAKNKKNDDSSKTGHEQFDENKDVEDENKNVPDDLGENKSVRDSNRDKERQPQSNFKYAESKHEEKSNSEKSKVKTVESLEKEEPVSEAKEISKNRSRSDKNHIKNSKTSISANHSKINQKSSEKNGDQKTNEKLPTQDKSNNKTDNAKTPKEEMNEKGKKEDNISIPTKVNLRNILKNILNNTTNTTKMSPAQKEKSQSSKSGWLFKEAEKLSSDTKEKVKNSHHEKEMNEDRIDGKSRSPEQSGKLSDKSTPIRQSKEEEKEASFNNQQVLQEVKEKRNLLLHKLKSMFAKGNSTRVWYETKQSCNTKSNESLVPYSKASPSSLCKKSGDNQFCFCKGNLETMKFKSFCGYCKPTFVPEKNILKAKKEDSDDPDQMLHSTSNLLQKLMKKLKRRKKLLSKEWKQMNSKGECDSVDDGSTYKFIEQSPSDVCRQGLEPQCLCVRNPGQPFRKVCGNCSLTLRAKPQT